MTPVSSTGRIWVPVDAPDRGEWVSVGQRERAVSQEGHPRRRRREPQNRDDDRFTHRPDTEDSEGQPEAEDFKR